MQPFRPVFIIVFLSLGLALGVFAFFHQPGAPILPSSASSTAQVLEPLKLSDTKNMKLFNN